MADEYFSDQSPADKLFQRVNELLHYDAATGVFTWKVRHGRKISAGKIAGHKESSRGYIDIRIDGKKIRAHRLAYLYVTGVLPIESIDHIDGDKKNNRWSNLRLATASGNRMNSVKLASNNSSGITGVYWDETGKRWKAAIRRDGAYIHVAYAKTPEEAGRHRAEAEKKHFGEFAPNRKAT